MLGATLPASAHVPNWSPAWVGLDLAEAVAALFTATLLTRGSPRAAMPAAAGAALLLADAWFDLCTSPPGLDRLLAVGEAVLVELPLAAAAIWLAVALRRDTGRGRPEHGDEARALLDRYIRWVPSVDRFAPVLVETDFEATVLDPDGADVAEMARSDGFWPRPEASPEEGRLGGRSWAMGRGAAPPRFGRDRRG